MIEQEAEERAIYYNYAGIGLIFLSIAGVGIIYRDVETICELAVDTAIIAQEVDSRSTLIASDACARISNSDRLFDKVVGVLGFWNEGVFERPE
jgi:hypothetical protein